MFLALAHSAIELCDVTIFDNIIHTPDKLVSVTKLKQNKSACSVFTNSFNFQINSCHNIRNVILLNIMPRSRMLEAIERKIPWSADFKQATTVLLTVQQI